jgi:adenine phosphoribosyltransferase
MGCAADISVDLFLKSLIREIPDFPVDGIGFKDITPLLANEKAFALAINQSVARWRTTPIELVVAIESRGFLLGAPLAHAISAGLVLVRKPGKLPAAKDRFAYTCEYCSGTLEVHKGSITLGKKCLVVDDLLATGGTAVATAEYVKSVGGDIAGFSFLVELSFLNGRTILSQAPVHSVIAY